MSDLIARAERLFLRINQLASISEDGGNITRTFGTDAFMEGSKLIFHWMQQAGLQTRADHIGNVRGRWVSRNPGAKTLVIASHIDTVVNAGKFDGPLGVLIGLAVLEKIIADKTELPFHIELIAFSDEEGVRFHTTYLGSKVVAGSFENNLLTKKDKNGISLSSAINYMGGNAERLAEDALPPADWLAYYEVHIEQGPVLYERDIPVAIVTAIAGQKRVEITFAGMAGHAGTMPMDMRNDALCCAAEFIVAIEKFALQNKAEIMATVGKLDIVNSASNVIPGMVTCSLDLRSADDLILATAYGSVKEICEAIAQKRGISVNWYLIQETKAVACSAQLNHLLKSAIASSGIELVELVSGAGHDAVPISQVAPVSMLFVRCFKGISHNPLENAEIADVATALAISDKYIDELKDSIKTKYGNFSIDPFGC